MATLASAGAFAATDANQLSALGANKKGEELTIVDKKYVDPNAKSKLGYVEILTGTIANKDVEGLGVGLSLGKTFFFDQSGIDLSFNMMANESQSYWSFPKIMWNYYQPMSKEVSNKFGHRSDFFFGFGASLGGTAYYENVTETWTNYLGEIQTDTYRERSGGIPVGLFADTTIGARINFNKDMKGTLKLSLSAPFAPHFDSPVITGSFGVQY